VFSAGGNNSSMEWETPLLEVPRNLEDFTRTHSSRPLFGLSSTLAETNS
jgi:hypothetical protein